MIDLSHKPTITGAKVLLRPFHAEDYREMAEILKDPEVIKFTGSAADFDETFLQNWYATRNDQGDRLDLDIEDREQQCLVGEVVMNEYDEESHGMNFRILIGPRGRDRGLGTEATRLMIDYAFSATDLNRITLGVYAFNPRGRRVYEKVGFKFDKIEEHALEHEGQPADCILMALTREDWRAARADA